MFISERENDLNRVEWAYGVYGKIITFLYDFFSDSKTNRNKVLEKIKEEPSINYDEYRNVLEIALNHKYTSGKYDQFLKIPSLPYGLSIVFARKTTNTKGAFYKHSSKSGSIYIFHNSNDILSNVARIFDSSQSTFIHELNHMYDDYISYDRGDYTEYRQNMDRLTAKRLPRNFDPKYGKIFWDYKKGSDGYKEYRTQNAEINVILQEFMTKEYRLLTTGIKSYKRGLKMDFEDTRSLMYSEGYLDDENATFNETLEALYRFTYGYCDRNKFIQQKYKDFETFVGVTLDAKLKQKITGRLHMFYDKLLNKLNLDCK